jgi:hypothetical protein
MYICMYMDPHIYIHTRICIYIYIHIHSVSIIQKIHNIHNIYIYIYWYVSVYTSTFFFGADPLPPRCRKTFLEVVPSSSWCPAVRRSKSCTALGDCLVDAGMVLERWNGCKEWATDVQSQLEVDI